MTTGFRQAPPIDAAAFDSLIGDAVRGRPAGGAAAIEPSERLHAAPRGSGRHIERLANDRGLTAREPAAPAALAAQAVDSTPDLTTFARHLGRSVRTSAPLLGADLASLTLAGLAAWAVLEVILPGQASLAGLAAPLALVPVLVGYWLAGLYSEVWVHPAVEMRQTTHVTTVALLALAVAGLRAPPLALWCAVAWLFAVALVPLLRAAARHGCAARGWWGFPTLVIGRGHHADALARELMRWRRGGLRPILVTDPAGACRASAVPVVNDPAVLRSLVRAKGVRHAVVCLCDLPAAEVSTVFDRYGSMASHLLVLCETPPLPALWGVQRACGIGGVEVRNGLLLAPLRAVKRATDVAVALAVLVGGLPVLAGIALLVKLSSPGPILYGHRRLGRYGRHFTAWKFRTMHRGADKLLDQHFERFPSARLEWERDQKLRHDPRVTRVGHVLRCLSLDELPQMWNVLRGEMSVVGPRPIVDEEVEKYGDAYPLYAGVKPGITGLWQVSGRTDVGYEMRVRLDEFYVRHWSPWLDAYLLARTVVALLCRRGAY